MQDNTLPAYDRAPSDCLKRLCRDGGLLRPLIQLNGDGAAEQHGGVPLDVHFRREHEIHVYCGHPRIIRAKLAWADVRSKAVGEGLLQARWAHLGHAETPGWPWTMIDQEAQFSFPSKQARGATDERAGVDVGPARQVILDIARLREPKWSEPGQTGGKLDQLAVDDEGNLVLVEIKDAASTGTARLCYAPGLFKSPDFSDGRRIRRGVGRLRLAGGGCRSVLSGGVGLVGEDAGRLVGLRTRRFARCREPGRGLLAGRGAQPDGGVGTASRASCGRAA